MIKISKNDHFIVKDNTEGSIYILINLKIILFCNYNYLRSNLCYFYYLIFLIV